MMHPSDNVIWHEGLLMAPQHMQAQARYHDAQLHQRLSAVATHAWGVVRMDYDETSLAHGLFGVRRADVILPSGLVVSLGSSTDEMPLTLNLGQAQAHASTQSCGTRVLDVYMAVARGRDGLANVATGDVAQKHQRYRSHSRVMAEQTFGQTEPVEVLLAQPYVQLLCAHELSGDMEHVHIAQLELAADGTWSRRQNFAPAALRLHQHKYWLSRLETLVRRLRGAASALAPLSQMAQRQRHAQATLRFSDVESLLQLRALQTVIATVDHVLEDKAIAPREAYLLLKQALVAGAPLLGSEIIGVAPYHHVEQGLWLAQLVTHLEAMAPSLRVSVSRIVAEPADLGHWHVVLPRPALKGQAHVMLEIAAPHDPDEVATRWIRQAKVAAPAALEHLMRSALAGISLTHLDMLPDGMHPKADHVYLALDVTHDRWAEVLHMGVLGIAPPNEDDAAPAATLLIAEVLKPQQTSS